MSWLRVLGSLESQLFVRVDTAGFFCGAAHETSGSSFVLWDLHTQSTRVPLDASFTAEERAAVEANEMAAARKVIDDKLRARNEDAEHERNLKLVALLPSFGASGVAFDLMFAVPACRTCSDEIWSDYAIAARVPLHSPVKSLGSGLTAAASLTPALAHRGLKLMGLSRVLGTASERASARRQFNE